jgi:putative hydrolase of the HAD superfamily
LNHGGSRVEAVFFDVDFTLIYPGPTFQGEGYARFGREYAMTLDPARFADAVRAASAILDDEQQHVYDGDIFVRYTGRIIEEMGGRGPRVRECAQRVYDEWAANHHFFLYEDVAPALRALAGRGLKLGLISNSHRPLAEFQRHFELDGLIAGAISSSEHGYMKPHPSIFEAALHQAGVVAPEAVMVGDSVAHDIEGARRLGMRGVLVARSKLSRGCPPDIPVIYSLRELRPLL